MEIVTQTGARADESTWGIYYFDRTLAKSCFYSPRGGAKEQVTFKIYKCRIEDQLTTLYYN